MPWKEKPCGHRFCAAAYRIVWAEHDWTMRQCADAIGHSVGSIHRAGEMLSLAARPRLRPAKRLSRKSVERAWLSREFGTLKVAAASLGVSAHVLRYQARDVYNLPPRKWAPNCQVSPCRWFAEMWGFNVSAMSIAVHMGVAESTVFKIARRMTLPSDRAYDRKAPKPTVADFMREVLPSLVVARQAEFDRVTRMLRAQPPGEKLPKAYIAAAKKLIESRRVA